MTKYNSFKNLPNRFTAALALAFLGTAACSNEPDFRSPLVVEEAAGVQSLSTTPWPNDLFRDENGHIAITVLPVNSNTLTPLLLKDLNNSEDGFGVTSGAFFPVSGSLNSGTLDGNVALYGVDDDNYESIPVYAYFRKSDSPAHIYLRPANGNVLLENHHYAYVITRNVRSTSGKKLEPSNDLNDILFGKGSARAKTVYNPLLSLLDGGKVLVNSTAIARADVAAATVFTTHSVTKRLQFVNAALNASAPPMAVVRQTFSAFVPGVSSGTTALDDLLGGIPAANNPGLDNSGGIAHNAIAYVVQGTFQSADYIDTTNTLTGAAATQTNIGTFTEATAMQPTVRQMSTVPFTLVLPRAAAYSSQRVVIFQHNLGADRSAVMGVANQLATSGIATIAIDAPFHGARAVGATDNAFTFKPTTMQADGWAEATADATKPYFDALGSGADIPAFSPASVRAHFMQGAIDIMQLARLITVGDWSQLSGAGGAVPGLAFVHDEIGMSGDGFGGMLTGIATAIVPQAGAQFSVNAGGGIIFPVIVNSATYGPEFQALLDAALGTNTTNGPDPADTDFAYNLEQQLVESGDPLAYTPYIIRAPFPVGSATTPGPAKDSVLITDYLDEKIPNQAQEALGKGQFLNPVSTGNAVPNLTFWPNAPATAGLPIAGNVMSNGFTVTAAFVQYQSATATLFVDANGTRTKDLTTPYPYKTLATPTVIANPISQVQLMLASFMNDYFNGGAPPTLINSL
jgi:hypothetical protein